MLQECQRSSALIRSAARASIRDFAERQIMERGAETAGSICLDACELHHLAPLLGFLGDQPAKVGRGAGKHRAA